MIVFSQQWFKKYNKQIVWLAKLPFIGEWIFCFKKYGHYVDRQKICEVTPNSVVEDLKLQWTKCVKVKGQWVAYDCTNKLHNRLIKKECKEKLLPTHKQHFFVRNEYALRLQKVFYPIWITFHTWDNLTRPIPQLNLGFDTLTVYPDAGTGGTTCDANMVRSTTSETQAVIVAGAGTGVDNTNIYNGLYFEASTTTNQYDYVRRNIETFDTSELTSGAIISSVVWSGYFKFKGNDLGSSRVYLVASTPASNNVCVAADYSQLGTTSFGYLEYTGITLDAYNDITLNASGIANVSKTGISKFGVRFGFDGMGETPTWSSAANSQVGWYSGDNATNKPKLVITYTTTTFIPKIIMN